MRRSSALWCKCLLCEAVVGANDLTECSRVGKVEFARDRGRIRDAGIIKGSVVIGPAVGEESLEMARGSLRSTGPVARVVLAAEVRLYREGLSQALAGEPEIEVLATSRNCEELWACLETVSPEVVVVDTGMNGWLSATRSLARSDVTRVVALGVRGLPDEVITLAEAGVAGYVTREDPFERLVEVVLSVARGEMPCSPQVSWHLMRRVASLAAGVDDVPLDRFTSRELEILRLIEQGLANKEIARCLSIQLATVKNHVRSVLEKLEVHTRGEAAAVVRRCG